MPIYEFYLETCNVIFSFFSRTINTRKKPVCPQCGRKKLERLVSMFAATGNAKEAEPDGELPADDAKMERAIKALAGEAEHIDEHNPKMRLNC